jgi:hypothetical protein
MNEQDARAHLRVFSSEHTLDLQKYYEVWMENYKNLITDVLVQYSTSYHGSAILNKHSVAVFFNLRPGIKKEKLNS